MMLNDYDDFEKWCDGWMERKGIVGDNDSEDDVTFILLCTYERAYSSSFSEWMNGRERRYSEKSSSIAENRLIGDGDDDDEWMWLMIMMMTRSGGLID